MSVQRAKALFNLSKKAQWLPRSSTAAPFFTSARPQSSENSTSVPTTEKVYGQAPNRFEKWSTNQQSRPQATSIPRFEQTVMEYQPNPPAAIDLIAQEPIRVVHGRKAVCDGGGGPLGHPKVYINLDKPGPRPCGYCGIQFQQAPHEH